MAKTTEPTGLRKVPTETAVLAGLDAKTRGAYEQLLAWEKDSLGSTEKTLDAAMFFAMLARELRDAAHKQPWRSRNTRPSETDAAEQMRYDLAALIAVESGYDDPHGASRLDYGWLPIPKTVIHAGTGERITLHPNHVFRGVTLALYRTPCDFAAVPSGPLNVFVTELSVGPYSMFVGGGPVPIEAFEPKVPLDELIAQWNRGNVEWPTRMMTCHPGLTMSVQIRNDSKVPITVAGAILGHSLRMIDAGEKDLAAHSEAT